MSEDLAYKIIVIGDVGVGKSNVSSRYCDGTFYEDIVPTIGMDFKYCHSTTLEKKPRTVRLQIWDTSGQDRFVTLTTAFYRNCNGVMLCFDITSRVSFEDLDAWYERLEANCPKMPPVILVGCKLDLVHKADAYDGGISLGSQRQVEKSEADAWARSRGCLCYLETSAKENTNVSEAFQQLATYVAQNTTPAVDGGRSGINGRDGRPIHRGAEPKKGCCSSF
ncbi:small GTP-binding protein Rab7 [Trypanosoma conorhini]|uniref:Small GTP-binding protein Rab7 n=2 Tax=Trypanosoma conorhini TaxID=83891 RepID=A0A422QBB9_9TRYP|nr:small GTP-binding protein Rab7 [Trypanosoma conorhini]RNF27196.1 small GTP-binding protein Rab7 [Trypanosoma conorhini]